MQFLTLLDEVLVQRGRDGIRGLDREHSRARRHVRTAKFIHDDVASIGKPAIRQWVREMGDKDALGAGEKRKLSRETICRCLSLVSTVFQEAVNRELIQLNPCVSVKPPKRVDETNTRLKWAYLTADEQRAIDACDAIPRAWRLVILIAIDTGMRQGEQRHLRISDLELDGPSPCIHIRVAGRTKEGKPLPPKSGKPRVVPLLPDAVARFREWLAMLPSFAPSNPHDIVFPTASGGYWQQGKMFGRSDAFRKYLLLVGITRRVRWHDLRHTYATNGIVLYGWKLEIVQGLMGHSSITITQRYAHIGEDELKSVIRKTAEAMAAAATAAPETIEVPAINEVVEVATPPAAIVVREPEPVRVVEDRGLLGRFVGFFRNRKEVSHVV